MTAASKPVLARHQLSPAALRRHHEAVRPAAPLAAPPAQPPVLPVEPNTQAQRLERFSLELTGVSR